MKLDDIIAIANEVLNNEIIPEEGLVMKYLLDEETHLALDEELFYNTNNNLTDFKHNKLIELTLGGITFQFEIK
jgi:hypothetical protein